MYVVLESGIRDIYGEVRNSLDFHRSQEGGGEVSHVVLSGAAQDIPGFADALQGALGIEVKPRDVQLVGSARGESPPTGSRSPPGSRSRRSCGEGRQPDPRRAPRRRRRRDGPLQRRRLRGDRARRRARPARAAVRESAHDISSDTSQAAKLTTEAERERSDAGALARYNGLIAASEARTAAAESLVEGASTGPTHSTKSAASCRRKCRSPRYGHDRNRHGKLQKSIVELLQHGRVEPRPPARRAQRDKRCLVGDLSDPSGSVPTLTLTGCANSQPVVAQMLQRMKLIDGVKEATLTAR